MNEELIGKGFHMLTKPIGPVCNLNCSYCFYIEKKSIYPNKRDFRMSDEILESFIQKYISSQQIPEIQFVWQGGEPTLIGLDFYCKAVSFQKKTCKWKENNQFFANQWDASRRQVVRIPEEK